MIIVLPIFHAWLNSSQLDSLSCFGIQSLGRSHMREPLGTPLCIIVRMQVERQRSSSYAQENSLALVDPGEGYRDCTSREGAASSAQCSLCLREASWSWVSSLLCKEDSALFLLCFSLGSFLSQTSLILFSPFPSFPP